MANKKHPYRVQIINRGATPQEKTTLELDGILLIGTRIEEHQNAVINVGPSWPFMNAKIALEAICQGHDAEFVRKLKDQALIILDALVEEETPAPLNLHEGEANENMG